MQEAGGAGSSELESLREENAKLTHSNKELWTAFQSQSGQLQQALAELLRVRARACVCPCVPVFVYLSVCSQWLRVSLSLCLRAICLPQLLATVHASNMCPHLCECIHECTRACLHAACVHANVCVNACRHVCACVRVNACRHVHVCVHACLHACCAHTGTCAVVPYVVPIRAHVLWSPMSLYLGTNDPPTHLLAWL